MTSTITTLGHACLFLKDSNNIPILLTDPWLIGSVYWRSWWLQHYPNDEELEELSKVKYVYITHEHPDHLHIPSIRKLGKNPTYICPDLPDITMPEYLISCGFNVETPPIDKWMPLSEEISVLSIPLWNDDSLLLIKTPTAFIVNLNDAKPNKKILKKIKLVRDSLKDEKIIVLSSYSAASMVNSFIKNGTRINVKNKLDYVKYLNNVCDYLNADIFMPFASQAVFLRNDSQWANEYKVNYEDLKKYWTSKTELVPPYSTIDLETFEKNYVSPEEYNSKRDIKYNLITQQEEIDAKACFEEEDIKRLEDKLNSTRLFSMFTFSKGIGFLTNQDALIYSPWSGKIKREAISSLDKCSFWFKIPINSLKESLYNDHFGDLGITMFIEITLNYNTNPNLVCLFFVFVTINDYKHTKSIFNFFRWIFTTARKTLFSSPNIPLPEQLI
jgi:hypothetical protein